MLILGKKIWIINAGTSSIKFKIYNATNKEDIAWEICERIFIDESFKLSYFDEKEEKKSKEQKVIQKNNFKNHVDALD